MPRRPVLFLLLLAIGPAGCGGGSHSPSGPTTMPTPPGTSVTLVVFYDENANGTADGTEVVRVPDVEVSVGGRTGKSEKLTGQAVVTGVQNGSYTVAIRNDTLPPFFQPGAPVNIVVPLGQGSQTFVPLLLPIGRNNPNQYLAFGDSITRGDGSTDGHGYPPRLQAKLTAHFGYASVRNRGADATNSYEAVERINNNNNLINDAYALILYGTNDWNIPECQDSPAACQTIPNMRMVAPRVKSAGTPPARACCSASRTQASHSGRSTSPGGSRCAASSSTRSDAGEANATRPSSAAFQTPGDGSRSAVAKSGSASSECNCPASSTSAARN